MNLIKQKLINDIEQILLEKDISHYYKLYNIYIKNYSSKILEIGVNSSKYLFIMYSLDEEEDENSDMNILNVTFSFDKEFLLKINLLDLQHIKLKLYGNL